jgi:hypothetical protein
MSTFFLKSLEFKYKNEFQFIKYVFISVLKCKKREVLHRFLEIITTKNKIICYRDSMRKTQV